MKTWSSSAIDIRERGARKDSGVTDNAGIIQAAIDELGDAGGGQVYVSGQSSIDTFYGISVTLWMRDNVHLVGDGPSSWIHNYWNNYPAQQSGHQEGSVIFFGGHFSNGQTAWYNETAYNIDDVAPGDYILQCQTHSDAANVAAGAIIWACGAEFNTATGQDLPLESAMNEVISADASTGLVTVKYPIDDPLVSYLGTPAFFRVSTGTLRHPTGHTVKVVKRASVERLKLSQVPGWTWGIFPAGSMWECVVRDLELDGEVAFSGNWYGRCLIENIRARLTRKGIDCAVGSIGTTWRNWNCHYYPGPVGAGLESTLLHIANGERTRDNVFDKVDAWSAMAMNMGAISAKRTTVRNCNFTARAPRDNVNGLLTLTQDDSTVHAEACIIENNRFRVPTMGHPALTVQAKPGQSLRNVVRGNTFDTPISHSMPTIDVRTNGSDVLLQSNHLPNGWIRVPSGTALQNVELRNNTCRQSLMVQETFDSTTTTHNGTAAETEFIIYTVTVPALTELATSDTIQQCLDLEVWGTYGGNAGTGILRLYDQTPTLQAFWNNITGLSGATRPWHLLVHIEFRIGNAQFWMAELQYNGTTHSAFSIGQAVDLTTTDYSLELRGIIDHAANIGGDALTVRRIEVRPGAGYYRRV